MFNPILYYEYALPKQLTSNLVAYYNLNGNTNDITGTSPNGSGSSITYVSGINNQAVYFNTTSSWVDIPDNDNFSFTTGSGNDVSFSISLWVYFTVFTTATGDYGNWLFNKRTAVSGGDEWQLVKYKEDLCFFKFDRVTNSINQSIKSIGNPFLLNNWYHIVFTDNGSKNISGMKFYLNGSLLSTTDNSVGVYTGMPNGTSNTRMGMASWINSFPQIRHQGYIDEVAVWKNRELTTTEITQLYNSGVGKFYPF